MQKSQAITLRTRSDVVIPPKGYVVINGQTHLVGLTPYSPQPTALSQPPLSQPPVQPPQIVQHPASPPTAQYELPTQPQRQPFTFPAPLNIALAAITMLLFAIAVSMASIGLSAYSHHVERTDRLHRLIYVEP